VLKKWANNLYYSRQDDQQSTKTLYLPRQTHDGGWCHDHIDWNLHLKQPFLFLQKNVPLAVDPRLSLAHFDRSSSFSKMNVGLAAQLFSRKTADMLTRYLDQQGSTAPDTTRSSIQAVKSLILLLDQFFDVANGRSKQPGTGGERRLRLDFQSTELQVFCKLSKFVQDWRDAIVYHPVQRGADGTERELRLAEHFLTLETAYDTQLCALGVVSFVRYMTAVVRPGLKIYPKIISQDGVEKHFSAVRASIGAGAAPNAMQAAHAEASAHLVRMFCSEKAMVENWMPNAEAAHYTNPRRTMKTNDVQRNALAEISIVDFALLQNSVQYI
jgi:hypothetical protein